MAEFIVQFAELKRSREELLSEMKDGVVFASIDKSIPDTHARMEAILREVEIDYFAATGGGTGVDYIFGKTGNQVFNATGLFTVGQYHDMIRYNSIPDVITFSNDSMFCSFAVVYADDWNIGDMTAPVMLELLPLSYDEMNSIDASAYALFTDHSDPHPRLMSEKASKPLYHPRSTYSLAKATDAIVKVASAKKNGKAMYTHVCIETGASAFDNDGVMNYTAVIPVERLETAFDRLTTAWNSKMDIDASIFGFNL